MLYAEKAVENEVEVAPELVKNFYKITETKLVKDVNGVEFEIKDRLYCVSLVELEAQKAIIQEKIDLIKGLGV